jgi:hypothetical protein
MMYRCLKRFRRRNHVPPTSRKYDSTTRSVTICVSIFSSSQLSASELRKSVQWYAGPTRSMSDGTPVVTVREYR